MRKLYLFTNTKGNGNTGWEHCLAMADDGVVLGSHLCSSVGFMMGDLFSNRPDRKEIYEKHFGGKDEEAYEIIELRPGELPPEDVLEKNKQTKPREDVPTPKIEITIEE